MSGGGVSQESRGRRQKSRTDQMDFVHGGADTESINNLHYEDEHTVWLHVDVHVFLVFRHLPLPHLLLSAGLSKAQCPCKSSTVCVGLWHSVYLVLVFKHFFFLLNGFSVDAGSCWIFLTSVTSLKRKIVSP